MDKEEAEEGEFVTIGAVPEDGWLLSGLYAKDGEVGIAVRGLLAFAQNNIAKRLMERLGRPPSG